MAFLLLAGVADPAPAADADANADPIDILPVSTYATRASVDDVARCIGEGWAQLSVFMPGRVTLHPSLRGLIVDVKAAADPVARVYAEAYPSPSGTRVDYFVRGFVHDPNENLRLRALQRCM